MSDLIPGISFANGQSVTAESLNSLVGNATIDTGVIGKIHLQDETLTASIFDQDEIETNDITGEEFVLVWSPTLNKIARLKKSTFSGTLDALNVTPDGYLIFDNNKGLILGREIATSDNIPTGLRLDAIGTTFTGRALSDTHAGSARFNFIGEYLAVLAGNENQSATLSLHGNRGGSTNTWYLQSNWAENVLSIKPHSDNSGNNPINPMVQVSGVVQADQFVMTDGTVLTGGTGGGSGSSAFSLNGSTLTLTSNEVGTATFAVNGSTLTITT
jgi:hypothetical protein